MIINKRRDIVPSTSRYNYKITNFKGIDAESDESALSLDYCSYGYNISIVNGALMSGMGIGEPYVTLAEDVKRLIPSVATYGHGIQQPFLYRKRKEDYMIDDRIILLLEDFTFHECEIHDDSNRFKIIDGMVANNEKVSCLNYHMNDKDVFLVCLDTGGMYVYDGESVEFYQDAPPMYTACLHYERLYGAKGNTLYFSNDLHPTDWEISANGAGYINLMDEGGSIKKILSFKDYIFIFREHSIHRLTAYTTPSEYKLTKVFDTNGTIIEDTIAVAGDRIIFMADKELYAFDGYGVKRIFNKVTALIADQTHSTGAFYKNKYYLSTRLITKGEKIGDEINSIEKNNGILYFDLYNGDVGIFRGGDIAYMMPLISGSVNCLLTNFNNKRRSYIGMVDDSGRIFGLTLSKLWVSPKSNLGRLDCYKILRRLRISSLGGVTIKTVFDDNTEEKSICGSPKPILLTYRNIGEDIRLQLSTDNDNLYINYIMLEFDFSRRYYAD